MKMFQALKGRLFGAAMAGVCVSVAAPALAQDAYPNKPIRLLLGFAPGGGSDMVARLIAKPLGERLGQSVVVDNKPGAGGNIAADLAAKAVPDGYTLVLLPSGHASNAAMKKTLPFNPVNDFGWIGTITTYPLSLSVAPNSQFKTFQEFIQRTKSEPGRYTYTSVGVGTAMHLVGEWLMSESGGSATHVPFKGGTGPLTELLAGRVDVMIDTMTSTAPLLKEQRLRALAVTSPKGESNLPGVPSVADFYPKVVFESWLGIAAPAGTPPAIVARLNRELKAVVDQPEIRQKLIGWGGSPKVGTPAEFRARVDNDIQNMRRIVAERRIETE
ncbi:MAG: tripartite tricarboxylate transporter substrate binding protein [Pseudomonadota bacterium]|uniref:Bug family tripartite tricarboxylate transporter substrate binding protein n=1 Tax=Polaromonas aquatica TaxID=332657 RepID=A0ABW1U2U4_9BURK